MKRIIILIGGLFCACSSLSAEPAHTSASAKSSASTEVLSCTQQIEALILDSALTDYATKNLALYVEEVQQNLIRIKLTHPLSKGEERPLIYAWLDLDLTQSKLLNVTYDPDAPEQININTKHIEGIKISCLPSNNF